MRLIALLLFEAIAAGVGIRLLTAPDTTAGAIPTLLHIGGVEHQDATTVIYPHLELCNTHTHGGEAVVDVAVGGEHIGEENQLPMDRDILAYFLKTKHAIANQA